MSPRRDFLQRFRPAGAPGNPAAAAVPADRARDLAAELEPVFSMLAGAQAESAIIVSEADRDAAVVRGNARRRADDMVASARQRAQAVRADAAAAVLARAEANADAALRAAEQDAQAIGERAARQMPEFVSRAVRAVLALAGDNGEAGDGTQVPAAAGRAP